MPEKYPRFYRIILLLVCCLVVLPFFILAIYNHPLADDYVFYLYVHNDGLFAAWQKMLDNWSGRYVSIFLSFLLNPLHFSNPDGAIIIVTFIQLLLYILFWYLITIIVDQLFGLKHGKLPAFTLLLIYGFCYLHQPFELLYWFSSSWAYLPGLVALTAWAVIRTSDEEKPSMTKKVAFVILPFLIAGTNEINIVLMGALLTIPYTASPSLNKLRIVVIILFLAGSAFALLAPGNYVRAKISVVTNYPVFDISFSLRNSLKNTWFYFRDWTRSSPMLFIPAILFLLTGNKVVFTTQMALKRIILISSGAILIYLFLPFPCLWATGMEGLPGRVLDPLFLCLTSIFIFSGTAVLINRMKDIRAPLIFPLILIFTLFWMATYNSKYSGVIRDVKVREAYETEYSTLIHLAKQAAKTNPSDTLVVPQHIRSYTVLFNGLKKNSRHRNNTGFARYYGIVGIKAITMDTIK